MLKVYFFLFINLALLTSTITSFDMQMKEALSEIIQLATVDSEPWVLMVADILKSFPETGSLNLDLEEQNPNVQDILGELREKGGYTTIG